MKKQIQIIRGEQIVKSLENTSRQYLVGRLSRPQELDYIEDDKLEIGITSYDEYISESPHYHTQAYEYQFIVKGMTEYIDVETGEVYTFKQGDFYVTPPGIKYAQRSQPGTEIFFVKTPPGNDKQVIETTDEIKEWLQGGK
ncbi:cupin domain-containing protein [uncultured Metabacillus sp.]|uniref:cupin domain-containing protein n=1 Tax=uncultured Metabacillus sp. TaxID=2860135 RepID=UPI002634C3B1|nr:cupin domain-containing protein [uncultured Metabacillus sp.]